MLNGTKEEVEKLRETMDERRAKTKTKVSFYYLVKMVVIHVKRNLPKWFLKLDLSSTYSCCLEIKEEQSHRSCVNTTRINRFV